MAHVGGDVAPHLVVDQGFDALLISARHWRVVREVETQTIGCDQRALLRDMLAEYLTQRRMQQVRRRVVEHDRLAARAVDLATQCRADVQRLAAPAARVAVKTAGELDRIAYGERTLARCQHAGVADLAARFGVERRAVEDQRRFVAVVEHVDSLVAAHDRDDVQAIRSQRLVAEELRWRELLYELGRQTRLRFELARRACALALFVHRLLEAGHVDGQAALACDVGGKIDRKSVGIVEAERVGAGNRLLHARGDFVEHLHAVFERLAETFFLGLERPGDDIFLRRKLGIGLAHFGNERIDELVEERLLLAQHVAVAQRAADDAALHVAAAFVRRQHAIDDEKTRRADVIGDHAQ